MRESISQWRGYADDGKGVAVGFRPDLVKDLPPFDLGRQWDEYELTAVDVVYDEPQQQRMLELLVDGYCEVCEGQPEEEWDAHGHTLLLELDHLRASMKNSGFKEERERRIVFKPMKWSNEERQVSLGKRNPLKLDVRATDDRLVEYVALPLPNDSIKEVVLGPKNLSDDETLNSLVKMNGFVGVEIKRSQVSYEGTRSA